MKENVRLLIVDRSELLAWMVARVSPPDVKVVRVETFGRAEKILLEDPPDGAIFNLVPCHPKWRTLIGHCVDKGRTVPFLCTAALEYYEACGCELPCRKEDFIPRGASAHEFTDRIAELMTECRQKKPRRFRTLRVAWTGRDEDDESLPVATI